jgi:hypothetical protein
MTVSFKLVRETFTSRVTLDRPNLKILVEYLRGPFSNLENRWTFEPRGEAACDVGFFIAYEFKSRMLAMLMGAMFDAAFQRFAGAFEQRAVQSTASALSSGATPRGGRRRLTALRRGVRHARGAAAHGLAPRFGRRLRAARAPSACAGSTTTAPHRAAAIAPNRHSRCKIRPSRAATANGPGTGAHAPRAMR